MKAIVKNVGGVTDAGILINGITVLTGKNSSGKSSFCKALYSSLFTIENAYESHIEDRTHYVYSELTNVLGILL